MHKATYRVIENILEQANEHPSLADVSLNISGYNAWFNGRIVVQTSDPIPRHRAMWRKQKTFWNWAHLWNIEVTDTGVRFGVFQKPSESDRAQFAIEWKEYPLDTVDTIQIADMLNWIATYWYEEYTVSGYPVKKYPLDI